jgi:hypothetical protein
VSSAYSLVLRYVVRSVLSFCLIVAVLLAGHWVLGEWHAFSAVKRDLSVLRGGEQQLGSVRARLRSEAAERIRQVGGASAAVLDARIDALGSQIVALSALPATPALTFPLPDGSELAQSLVGKSARMLQIELLSQERDYLLALRAAGRAALDRGVAERELAALHAAHVRAYDALNDNLRQQSRIRVASFLRSYVPGTLVYREREQLVAQEQLLVQANNAAARAVQAQQRAMAMVRVPAISAQVLVTEARLDAAMGELRNGIASASAYSAANWAGRMADSVRAVTPTALWIMLWLILTPLAIKLVFYFVLAPLAARLPPFYVDRGASGLLNLSDAAGARAAATGNSSAPSAVVTLTEGDELLIQPACIQSAPANVLARTRWLLDWANPFTCLAAGLFALTRISSSTVSMIVVSPALDPLAEIALITLPQGSSMVFQPRALVGLVHPRDQPVRIARYWRLWSLHAWLTLQLRYLVFRGPVTLIVKGCRGVRVDAVDQGRVISQDATLGFSTNTAYSTSRCQTLLPYLMGRAPLLNDRFDGAVGFCVYEEALPADGRKGVVGRGLEGLTDSLLKVFGV